MRDSTEGKDSFHLLDSYYASSTAQNSIQPYEMEESGRIQSIGLQRVGHN